MVEHTWKGPGLLALAATLTIALSVGPGSTPAGRRAIGWAVGLLGVASLLFLDAPLSVVLVGTGRMIYTDAMRRAAPVKPATPPRGLFTR